MPDHLKGLLLTGLGGLLLTFDIPLLKLGSGEAWSVLMLRSGTTFLAGMALWLVWQFSTGRAPTLLPGRAGLFVAGLYALASTTFLLAVYNTSTANLVFILAFNSMFAAALSWLFLGERPRPATLVAMAVMIVGVLVIVGDGIGAGNLVGDLLAMATALLIASALTVSRASGKDMGFTVLCAAILPCAVAAIMVGANGFDIAAPWWIVFNGAVVIPISFYCLATGPRFISAPEVAMFYLLETVLAPIWVWLIFTEVPTTRSLIGGIILVSALVCHSLWQLADGRRRRATAAVRHPA